MVNKPLIRPYFWGGYVRGGWLTSHKSSRYLVGFLGGGVFKGMGETGEP